MTVLSDLRAGRGSAPASRALIYLPWTALVIDAAIVSLSALLAAFLRIELSFFHSDMDVLARPWLAITSVTVGWLTFIWGFGAYRSDVFGAGTDEYKRIMHAGLYSAAAVGVGCYLANYSLSRGFFGLTFLIGIPALLVGRLVLRRFLYAARRRGSLLQRVVIVGGVDNIDEIARVLSRDPWLGYHVVGAISPNAMGETPGGVPILGTDPTSIVTEHRADVLFFTGGSDRSAEQLRQWMWALEDHAVQLVVAISMTDISAERVRHRAVGGLPLVHLEPPRWALAGAWSKRTFDVVGAGALILLTSPLLVFAALRVRLFDGGPVLFRQPRVGRNGETFSCLKFRSMVVDAEAQLQRLHAETGHSEGLFKMKEDPRITEPGRWLRRYSLDELPQLFNVFRGDMSLVGPRPPLRSEVDGYDEAMARRLRVRPGMTGLWQVSGRSDLTWDEAIRLDIYYVDNWSMLQDLSILFRTLGAVLSSRGAY